MSDVSNFGVLRFKFKKEFESKNEMYMFIKDFLGEPDEVEYKSNWNGKEFIKTDEVDFFSYSEKVGSYSVISDDDGLWYLDYHLINSGANYQDLDVSLDLEKLNDIKSKTFDKFPNLLYDSCKVKIFEWYTGCDIPVDF